MKKYFKKISALLMAAIMVLTMCATVFAAAVSDKNTATITITGLNTDETPTVRLYKVVKAAKGVCPPYWEDGVLQVLKKLAQ